MNHPKYWTILDIELSLILNYPEYWT